MKVYVLAMYGDGYCEDIKVFKSREEAQYNAMKEVVSHWGEDLETFHGVPVEELRKFCLKWFDGDAYLFRFTDSFEEFVNKWSEEWYEVGNCGIENSWWQLKEFDI